MFLLKILYHFPISTIKSKYLSVVFNVLMIWLIFVVASVITSQTCPALQTSTSYTSSLATCFQMTTSFPSVPLHMLCLDAFPFFALLGTHILPSRLSLDITSLKHSCSWLLYIPLTWQVDVLSSGSGSVIAATTLLGSCSLSPQNYDLQDRGFYFFIFLRPAFSTVSGKQ